MSPQSSVIDSTPLRSLTLPRLSSLPSSTMATQAAAHVPRRVSSESHPLQTSTAPSPSIADPGSGRSRTGNAAAPPQSQLLPNVHTSNPAPNNQPDNSPLSIPKHLWQILCSILPASTFVGNAFAVIAVAAAIITVQLALWTSEKDFREACRNLQVWTINIFSLLSFLLTGLSNNRL